MVPALAFESQPDGYGTEIGNLGLPDDSATGANDTGAEQSIRADAESHASADALAKQYLRCQKNSVGRNNQ